MRIAVASLTLACALAAAAGPGSTQPAAIERDSIEAMVRFLSVDPATHARRSRFVLREAEMEIIADSLAARLGRYTGNTVDRIPFTIEASVSYGGGLFTAENIVSRLEGTGEVPGLILVTAHYDATASRMAGFQSAWQTMPAPGADDNATGVAAVMELARIIPDRFCPFDILFVLFSGEELGMLGSEDFVSRLGGLYGDTICAAVNFDMLGYRAQPGAAISANSILTNYQSGWLAEMIVASAAANDPSLDLRVVKPAPSNYDHRSFWDAGIPAVTITEVLTENSLISNPFYHTTFDTLGSIDVGLVEDLTNAAGSYLTGLASAPAEIAMLPSDVMLMRGAFVTSSRLFESGESLGVLVRVRNIGGGDVSPGASVTLTVTIENEAERTELFSGEIIAPGPLGFTADTLRLELGDEFAGGNVVRAHIDVQGTANESDNDEALIEFGVSDGGGPIVSHGFRPNPVNRSFRSASFCVNLARETDIEIELFTIEGERIGAGHAGLRWGSALEAGLNCLDCDALFPAVRSLASGVYLYRLTCIDKSGGRGGVTGRFAVEN